MFSSRAREELNRYANAGHIGGAVELFMVPPQPRIGTEAQLHWDVGPIALNARLMWPDGEVEKVSAAGQRSVVIDQERMVFTLHSEGESKRIEVRPMILKPVFTTIDIARRVVAGEVMHCRIAAEHTRRLILTIWAPGLNQSMAVENASKFELRFPRVGKAMVQIEAEGTDMRYCEDAKVCVERQLCIRSGPLPIGVLLQRHELSSLYLNQGIVGQ